MSLFDLSFAVAAFSTPEMATLIHKRPLADSYDTNGVANTQTFTTTTLEGCCIQPGIGKKKIALPEGVRVSDVVRIYAPIALQPLDQITVNGSSAFAVQFGGHLFEIFEVGEFSDLGGFSVGYARARGIDEPRP